MDDYDLRRLRSFKDKTLRLSEDELIALRAVDPHISAEDLERMTRRSDIRHETTSYFLGQGSN